MVRIPGDPAWERAVAHGWTGTIEAFDSARLPPRWAAFRAVRRRFTRAADAVLVPSAYLAGLVESWGVPRARIAVIPNATPLAEKRAENPDHDLVWLGRMVAQKRLSVLANLAAALGVRLLLAGDGPEKPAPAPHLTLPGAASPDILRRGRLFVQASAYEGLPHAVLEAKARGLPVVATDAGGTRECVRHGVDGLLVPVGDDAALADAVRALLADAPRARAMGEAGRADARTRFAPAAMGDALATMLGHVVAERAPHG